MTPHHHRLVNAFQGHQYFFQLNESKITEICFAPPAASGILARFDFGSAFLIMLSVSVGFTRFS
jgi:hypothetical protein